MGYFQGKGRPIEPILQENYNTLSEWIVEHAENMCLTLKDLHTKMKELTGANDESVYGIKRLKQKLIDDSEGEIYFTSEERREDILCFRSSINNIIREYHKKQTQTEEEEAKKIIITAAKLICNDIKTTKKDSSTYPSVTEMAQKCPLVPSSLMLFLSFFHKSELVQNVWGQAFFKALRPRSGPMPYILGLALELEHKFGSKYLIDRLHSMQYCESYAEMLMYKWSYLKHLLQKKVAENRNMNVLDDIDEESILSILSDCGDDSDADDEDHNVSESTDATVAISEPDDDRSDESGSIGQTTDGVPGCSNISSVKQLTADNVDLKVISLYGNKDVHEMGMIEIDTPAIDTIPEDGIKRIKVQRAEKDRILADLDVPISQYYPKKNNGLQKMTFDKYVDILKEENLSYGDVAWLIGWMIKEKLDNTYQLPNWKGFMSSIHQNVGSEMSSIRYLPIIDGIPGEYSTIYTTLMRAINISNRSLTIITFDFPLWIKAVRIVLEKNLPVLVRLGGFHLLKSYLGSIEFIMKDSGLEDCFGEIYKSGIPNIICGNDYYKCLRAHFLIDAALTTFILESVITLDDVLYIENYINNITEGFLGCDRVTEVLKTISKKIDDTFTRLSRSGRTPKLWAGYHKMICYVKNFIRSERLHNFSLHLSTVGSMLPIFAAAGRGNYAKGCRLYLKLMADFKEKHTSVYELFEVFGYHTVRYNHKEWCGVHTDMSIEQTLMRDCKSIGGIKHGRFRNKESAHKVWCSTLHHLSDIAKTMAPKKRETGIHHDCTPRSKEHDNGAFDRVLKWFRENLNLSGEPDELISFNTNLISSKGKDDVNCEDFWNVGEDIQKTLDGGNFTQKISIKAKVKNLSTLRKKVKVGDTMVYIDNLVMFNRLSLLTERNLSAMEGLKYELTAVPMSLFDNNQLMRNAHKARLGNILKEPVAPSLTYIDAPILVIDGGWLLHYIRWKSNTTFLNIMKCYVDYIKQNGSRSVIVVFDGYECASTKDHCHKKRYSSSTKELNVRVNTCCTITQDQLLSNNKNKSSFISLLADELECHGIRTLIASDDADTLIVKTALEQSISINSDVEIKCEDTDVFVLLVYHYSLTDHQTISDIYVTTGECSYSVSEMCSYLNDDQKHNILFIHAISGCDTTSAMFGQGKKKVFKKLSSNQAVQSDINKFYENNIDKEELISAGIKIIQYIYGSIDKSLASVRYKKYNQMLAKGRIAPERLPPTNGAATQHLLRVYLQIQDWLNLSSMSLNPIEYGWHQSENTYQPVTNLEDIAPPEILNVIACKCNGDCTTRCGCKKGGLKCLEACGCGELCSNRDREIQIDNEMELYD